MLFAKSCTFALVAALLALLTSCGSMPLVKDNRNKMIVSVKDQRMLLVTDGQPVKTYRISTSKFGLGDQPGSHRTPIGRMEVARKIGGNHPRGAVFKSRRHTGEVLKPDAPGRDPIVSRILWLRGLEPHNRNAFPRYIYIHGTPERKNLGRPASFGCIRMCCGDVIDLYNRVGYGAEVYVTRGGLRDTEAGQLWFAANGNPFRRIARRWSS
ncbi:MAG: L,D-transpeptidase family protein [Luteolibacter sp.]